MNLNLFGEEENRTWREELCAGAVVLRGYALADQSELIAALESVVAAAPFRHMVTPGGFRMSVAMTNCGDVGWVTDRKGYRYDTADPDSDRLWPAMPDCFKRLANEAAAQAGYREFHPDACLINRYGPGARMSLHQDKDERDMAQPIVSLSLGIPATFLFGGRSRADKTTRVPLTHGDVVVWGGESRLHYHGILPLQQNVHPLLGAYRINITFRKAM